MLAQKNVSTCRSAAEARMTLFGPWGTPNIAVKDETAGRETLILSLPYMHIKCISQMLVVQK